MATASITKRKVIGGSFLLDETPIEEVFTPEDFNEQHQLIAQTTEDFANNEIVPNIDRIEHKDFALTRELIKKASELGISSVDVPEEYGGMEMDKMSSAIIADRIAKSGSFSVSFLGHSGIGTLPIVYFGTEDQKKKYVPRLASGELVGAYALSESSSGSDALNCRTKAVLSPDGKHYVLTAKRCGLPMHRSPMCLSSSPRLMARSLRRLSSSAIPLDSRLGRKSTRWAFAARRPARSS